MTGNAEYIILMPLLIMIFGLLPVVIRDNYLDRIRKRIMLIIVALMGVLVIQNVADYLLQTVFAMPYVRTLVGIVGYSVRPLVIVLFIKIVCPERLHLAAWILVILNFAVYSTAAYSPAVFYISEDNHFSGGILNGALSMTAHVVCAILLCYLVYYTIKTYSSKKAWVWMPIANAGLIVLATVLDISPAYRDYPVSYATIAAVCCCLFYYIWLHLEFVREHERDLMAEQRIRIMMSQIQPHFLYNTLSTIQALCRIDPKKAFATTEKFGTYLRHNLDNLDNPELIPLSKELEHTKLYADIEKLRFPSIDVEYDIRYDGFEVPALSIQPLVENAIRHGVRSREHGLVKVSAFEEDGCNLIVISDNGVGFDTSSLSDEDNVEHIGIRNVKERIEKMCGGTMSIDSRIDEGTVITVVIPKE